MATKRDKRFNSNGFENASHRHISPQIDKIIVPYKGTMLSKRPI